MADARHQARSSSFSAPQRFGTRTSEGDVAVISLRTRIVIGALAIGAALVAVLGDPMFQAIGAPGLGRPIVAAFLLVVGIAYFAWTSFRFHAEDKKAAAARRNKPTGR
jgi:hypothetical protein